MEPTSSVPINRRLDGTELDVSSPSIRLVHDGWKHAATKDRLTGGNTSRQTRWAPCTVLALWGAGSPFRLPESQQAALEVATRPTAAAVSRSSLQPRSSMGIHIVLCIMVVSLPRCRYQSVLYKVPVSDQRRMPSQLPTSSLFKPKTSSSSSFRPAASTHTPSNWTT